MDLGYVKISRLPLKVFYDEDAVNSNKRLPSEQRNIDIIRGITFIKFLKLLKENNESNIKSWFYEHDNKLRKHLNKMQEKFKQKPHTKYCKNLNYILDFVVQAIDNLNDIKYARVKHEFDENSRNILQSYTSLNCLRDLRNSENKNLYIKKIMYDLLDDIEYMLSRQNNPIRAQCLKMFNRIKYRRGILGNIYNTVIYAFNEFLIYLSYGCYSKLKSYFKRVNLYDESKRMVQLIVEQLKDKPQNLNVNDNIFIELARLLRGDHAFSEYTYHVTCMYINFWLNDEVKNKYSYVYDSKFHLFDDVATKFGTAMKNASYSGNSCKTYIKKLDDKEYRIKQILYNLYDLYTQHKTLLHKITREPLCDNINIIVKGSHDAKDHIKEDEDFAKRLKELKDLIKREEHHKNKCDYSPLINMLPKDDPIPKVETSILPVHKPTVTDQLPIPQHENLEHVEGDISGKAQAVLPGTIELPKETKLQEEESLTAMTPSQTLEEQLSFRVSQEGGPLDKRMSQENPLFRTWHQEARPLKLERELTQTDDHLYGDTQHAKSDERGVLGSIQHTITDVLGSVEPAPILGVSGGMGALFLLFKVLKTKFKKI
ncbi:hypothetical protein PVNG_05914 [Plasmodium vivax North Korean]|uniref:Uncharacterized protein n=1 Tax=Plasmodium vivax North Korean TaxID=1035514 RepID=A0A0J9WFC1_PLAVI|nr:hypothetical protein PVNG_05914 [Plasmodium vivax North Korean]